MATSVPIVTPPRSTWDVWLKNEDGVEVLFTVTSANRFIAVKIAWQAYRELAYFDNADPPWWTYPRIEERKT